jgi:ABC-type dipeptide/oligopeptide/nickel transport system permease subunit
VRLGLSREWIGVGDGELAGVTGVVELGQPGDVGAGGGIERRSLAVAAELALAEHREVHAGHRSERLDDRLARHLALEPFEGIAQGGEGLEGVDAHLLVRGVEPDLFSKHPLGTNNLSLDLLARSRHGARVSLLTSFLAVAIGLLVGGSIGVAAGFQRGRFDRVVGVFTDATLAFPGLILLIALAAMLGTPTTATEAVLKSGVALAIVGLPIMIRLARSQTLTFAQRAFVLAGRALGATKRRIMFAELAPNIALPLLSYALVLTAVLIVAEGSLAFLRARPRPAPTDVGEHDRGGRVDDVDRLPAHPARARRVHVPHRAQPQPCRRMGDGSLGPARVAALSWGRRSPPCCRRTSDT